MKFILLASLILNSILCSAQEMIRHSGPLTVNKHSLFVTHASKIFTENQSVKKNIDSYVDNFKSNRQDVIYLLNDDDETDSNWFTSDRNPGFAINSRNGDHDISIKADEVTVVGGFFSLCFDRTVEAIINSAQENGIKKLVINLPLNAIYEDKSIFLGLGNIDFPEMEKLFAIHEYKSMQNYKDTLKRSTFFKGLRIFFDSKSHLSYTVILDGKSIMKKRNPGKTQIIFKMI